MSALNILYIGGYGRSGSTLLSRLLGQIPGYVDVGELTFVWERSFRKNELCGCGAPFNQCNFWRAVVTEAFGSFSRAPVEEMLALRRLVIRQKYVPRLMRMQSTVSPSSYASALARFLDITRQLYEAVLSVSGARVIVDSSKEASYAFALAADKMLSLNVLHLVRDSRGVANAWSKTVKRQAVPHATEYMPRYHPMLAAHRWNVYNILFELLAGRVQSYFCMRYEDFTTNPLREISAMLARIDGTAASEIRQFVADHELHIQPTHSVSGNPSRFQTGTISVRRDDLWRTEMSRSHRLAVTILTCPLLVRYDYTLRQGI